MKRMLFLLMTLFFGSLYAQGTPTSAVRISNQTQELNNKKYYIHIVEQGQTLFSIARAYGLKYYDAVIKTDIHQMKVGDTVWLPFNEYSVAAVSSAATAQVSGEKAVHYIRVEAGQTLYGLSRQYGVSVDAIVNANPELRSEPLKAGQMLRMPARSKETALKEPVAEPKAEPVVEKPKTEPVAKQKAEPVVEKPKTEPVAKQKAEPVVEKPKTEPVAEQKAEPVIDKPKAEPVAKQKAEPVVEKPKTEPVAEQKAEPVVEKPKTEPVAEQKAEPVVEKPKAEPVVEQKAEPVVEKPKTEPVAEQKSEPVVEKPKTEPVAEQKAEPVIDKPKTEPVAEQKAEPVVEKPKTEPVVEQKTEPVDMEYDPNAKMPAPSRKVQNPYPFDEVPNDFPTSPAGYYNFSTPSSFNYQVRDRQSKDKIFVTIVMPFNLGKIDQISTSKFDIEQRGKKEYKIFEFIHFYEGVLIALDELKANGYHVVVNVVDLVSEQDADVEKAWNDYQMANSDFIVALLVKKPFDKLAQLAKANQVFVINPFAMRSDVVKDNPYVVKYMPSTEGVVKGMLDLVARRHKDGNLYIIHSNPKTNATNEKEYLDEFQRQLSARSDIKYTLFDWSANAKLVATLKNSKDNVIISLFNQDKSRNTVFATTLVTRLTSTNTNVSMLMTTSNWLVDYPSIDFEQLQHLNYTLLTNGHLDYDNPRHKRFIDTYKTKFKTEPNALYASVAHDIVYFFVSALSSMGPEFWRNPEQYRAPAEMLIPFRLRQSSPTGGYENQSPDIYQMLNYRLIRLN